MDTDKKDDFSENDFRKAVATALLSIAGSFTIIAATQKGLTPEQKAAIEKVTGDLKFHSDALRDAVAKNAL